MSSLLSVKLVRDSRANWSRFLLMAIAIAASLTVCGAVLYAWSTVGREARAAYLGTEPASATLQFQDAVDTQSMQAIVAGARQRPGVLAATGRTQFDSQVEINGESRDVPVQVFAATPNDPLDVARFDIERGSWPPAPGDIFMSRDTLTLLNASVGDVVRLQRPGGEPMDLRIAGTVYDPSLAPSSQEQRGHAYLSTAALGVGTTQPLLDQLKVQFAAPGTQTPSSDRGEISADAVALSEWLTGSYRFQVREIQVPPPEAHPHQFQADVLLLSLLGGGAAALLLSTFLVANMLNTLFTQQIPQIGIMKAIGARSGRVARMYLIMTLVVALAATMVAIVPGIWGGRLLASQILSMLGIEPTSLAPDWWTYLIVIGVGLLLPLLMTLMPLLKASRITVRAAIDHHGGSAKPSAATSALGRLSRGGGVDRTVLLALRNMVRRPARFLLAVGLLAGAGIVFVTGISLGDGMAAVAEEQRDLRVWDVEVQLADPTAMSGVREALEALPHVTKVEGLRVANVGLTAAGQVPITRTYPDQGHGRVSITAVPTDSSMFTRPHLKAGRWLKEQEPGAIVLSQIARDDNIPATQVGDNVQLSIDGNATTWRVVGIVEDRSGGTYATAAGLAAALDRPEQVNLLRIATSSHDEGTRTSVAAEVDQVLTAAGIAVKSSTSVSRANTSSEGHMGPLVAILLAIAIAMGAVGGIGLASTMSANILDRTREFGVMHAIGAQPKAVRRVVVMEGVFIGVASCVVAVLPALGLTAVLGAGLGNLFMEAPLPYRISLPAVVIWLVLAVLGSALATNAAATRASRITVREALAYL